METGNFKSLATARIATTSSRLRWLGILALAVLVCGGCSSQSTSADPTDQSSVAQIPGVDQGSGGNVPSLLELQDDPDLLAQIPFVVESEVLATTGLQVAYTAALQREKAPSLLVESQWIAMQSCLGQVAVAPVVIVRDTAVQPFTASDDVIHNIEGIPVASASMRTVPVVQILIADFDGSLGSPGFNLRSIMGRLLWLSAGLAERDYPYNCAREPVDTDS
jgi:hypothetical protein